MEQSPQRHPSSKGSSFLQSLGQLIPILIISLIVYTNVRLMRSLVTLVGNLKQLRRFSASLQTITLLQFGPTSRRLQPSACLNSALVAAHK
jgi:flagellar biogenesis protein FliO